MPLANKPILVHCLENIRAIGVDDVGIVVGDTAEQIRAVVGDGSDLGLRVTYIPQHSPLGLAHCVTVAADFLGDEDFVMYLGDNVLPHGVADAANEFRNRRPTAQLLLKKVTDPGSYGVAEIDGDGRVVRLVEKPDGPSNDLAVMGVYFFTPAIHAAVRAIRRSARGELEITDAIQYLVDAGAPVAAQEYSGYWQDSGSPDNLLECNRAMLRGITTDVNGGIDAESTVQGPVVVEPGARVIRSHLVGPVVVGADSVVRDSTVGPNTSLGRACVIEAAGVADSVLLEGVRVQGVGRLSGSVIGRSAVVVGHSEHAPHRLIIGDHTRAEVAA